MNEHIWIIDDDKSIRWVLEKTLRNASLNITSFDSADAALAHLAARGAPDVIISDIRMPGQDGLNLLAHMQQACPHVPVIIMTAHSDLDSAVQSYQGGAFEYLPKPFDVDEALALVRRALTHARQKHAQHTATQPAIAQADGMIGEAPAMQEVFRTIGRLSQSNVSVLINGASGTGKELVARALHRHSPRKNGRFVALNMAAIPRDLIESELFGHEKGTFTGADAQRKGRFEQASGGTLFLDEIGDMPMDAQTRLLRVLSEGSFYRVGGHTSIQADARIIAATHQDLESLVEQGRFREDLFYRLNVIRIHLPKLSERREDIVRLAQFFLQRAARDFETEPRRLLPETQEYLTRLDWPGNVRQLENVCRWLTVMSSSREVMINDLPPELLTQKNPGASPAPSWESELAQWTTTALAGGQQDLLGQALPAFERIMISAALRHTGGHRREAAKLLGWGRNTLTRKIQELDLDLPLAGDDDGN